MELGDGVRCSVLELGVDLGIEQGAIAVRQFATKLGSSSPSSATRHQVRQFGTEFGNSAPSSAVRHRVRQLGTKLGSSAPSSAVRHQARQLRDLEKDQNMKSSRESEQACESEKYTSESICCMMQSLKTSYSRSSSVCWRSQMRDAKKHESSVDDVVLVSGPGSDHNLDRNSVITYERCVISLGISDSNSERGRFRLGGGFVVRWRRSSGGGDVADQGSDKGGSRDDSRGQDADKNSQDWRYSDMRSTKCKMVERSWKCLKVCSVVSQGGDLLWSLGQN